MVCEDLPLVQTEDALTRASRGSKSGFVKLVFNFLVTQELFLETEGRYYPKVRFRALMEHFYDEHKGNYGYRRITLELRNRGFVVNQKKVQRLMKLLGLSSQIRRKRKYSSYQGEVGKKADNPYSTAV